MNLYTQPNTRLVAHGMEPAPVSQSILPPFQPSNDQKTPL